MRQLKKNKKTTDIFYFYRMILIVLFCIFYTCVSNAEDNNYIFQLKCPAIASNHLPLLQYPVYLGLILENCEIPFKAGTINVKQDNALRINGPYDLKVEFKEKKENVYYYVIDATWSYANFNKNLNFPFHVDASNVNKGTIDLHITSKVKIPEFIINHIKIKINLLAGPATINHIINYLDITSKNLSYQKDIEKIKNLILADSYNRSNIPGKKISYEPGDDESFSGQIFHFLSLAIWGGFILIFIVYIVYRKLRTAKDKI